jgi:hypothetical protein
LNFFNFSQEITSFFYSFSQNSLENTNQTAKKNISNFSWSESIQQQTPPRQMVYDKIPKKKPQIYIAPPPPPQTYIAPPQPSPQPPRNNWPDSLKRFVERAFETVKNNKIQKLSKSQLNTKNSRNGTIHHQTHFTSRRRWNHF